MRRSIRVLLRVKSWGCSSFPCELGEFVLSYQQRLFNSKKSIVIGA
jgi:hypothetical protein